MDAGLIVLTAFVSPFKSDRLRVRTLVSADTTPGETNFIEIYCSANITVCEDRDSKGLYRKARLGQITHFTGISSPYEEPDNPELILDSGQETVESCALNVLAYLEKQGII
jgi:adenylylsulfate kinase